MKTIPKQLSKLARTISSVYNTSMGAGKGVSKRMNNFSQQIDPNSDVRKINRFQKGMVKLMMVMVLAGIVIMPTPNSSVQDSQASQVTQRQVYTSKSSSTSPTIGIASTKRFAARKVSLLVSNNANPSTSKVIVSCGAGRTQKFNGYHGGDSKSRKASLAPGVSISTKEFTTNSGQKNVHTGIRSLCDIPTYTGTYKDCPYVPTPEVPNPPCTETVSSWFWQDGALASLYYKSYRSTKRLTDNQLISKKKAYKVRFEQR